MENDILSVYEEKSKYSDVESIIFLADYYLKNHEDDKAFNLLKKFEYLEDKNGYRKLAYLYENGRGTVINIEKAKKYYELAHKLGDVSAGYNLAVLFAKEKNYEQAIVYLSSGKFENHAPSIKMLGDFYRVGLGVDKNEDITINLYKEVIDYDKSLFDQIGVIYYQKKDFLNAFGYFEKGANILDKNALYHLGICFSKGQGTYLDMQKAIYYFEMAVKQGDYRSLYNLSLIYEKGLGVSPDAEKARILLEKYKNYQK